MTAGWFAESISGCANHAVVIPEQANSAAAQPKLDLGRPPVASTHQQRSTF